VSNTRFGRPQGGKPHADKGEEVGKQVFIADVLYGRSIRRRDSA